MFVKCWCNLLLGGFEGVCGGYEMLKCWCFDVLMLMEVVCILDLKFDMLMVVEIYCCVVELLFELCEVRIMYVWVGFVDSMLDGVLGIGEVLGVLGLIFVVGFLGYGFGIGLGVGYLIVDFVIGV